MLPRRHILDIWDAEEGKEDKLLMSTGTLVIDAIKYINKDPKRDHLTEALELNEFICYMEPSIRPNNLALLFHVTSDLLGLLLYGIPKKRQNSIEALEVVDYSSKSLTYPVIEVWNFFKDRIGHKRGQQPDVIEGFVRKIRIEWDIVERFPFIDDVFRSSREGLKDWLHPLSRFYEKKGRDITSLYDKWTSLWIKEGAGERAKEGLIESMVQRLVAQVSQDYKIKLDAQNLISSIRDNREANQEENERFSRLYKEGIKLLLSI